MTVYLVSINPPLAHAAHYIGFCEGEAGDRLADHKAGRSHASKLLQAALRAGSDISISYIWPDGDRRFEAWLKRRADIKKWCPCCHGKKFKFPLPSHVPSHFDGSTKTARRNRNAKSE